MMICTAWIEVGQPRPVSVCVYVYICVCMYVLASLSLCMHSKMLTQFQTKVSHVVLRSLSVKMSVVILSAINQSKLRPRGLVVGWGGGGEVWGVPRGGRGERGG